MWNAAPHVPAFAPLEGEERERGTGGTAVSGRLSHDTRDTRAAPPQTAPRPTVSAPIGRPAAAKAAGSGLRNHFPCSPARP
jgi:hypothetical protein